jgi:3-oxoadipate enol-lactonase
MPTAPINGTELYYQTAGTEGPKVLLVMGLRARGIAFQPLIERLQADHQVAWFDHRGVGESAALTGPTSMTEMAADAVGLMDHLGWEQAQVVGVSMGGMASLHLALNHRPRVQGLTLITTTARGGFVVVPSPSTARLYLGTLNGTLERRLGYLARILYSAEFLAREDMANLVGRLVLAFGHDKPGTLKAQLTAVSKHDVRHRLHELHDAPVLLVSAGKDRLMPLKHMEYLRQALPQAHSAHFPGAGHGVLAELADEVAEAVRAHVVRSRSQVA